jgi:hypothetical protein
MKLTPLRPNVLLAFFASMTALSCRPDDQNSGLKTLDQFAGSKRLYNCSGSHGGNDVYLPYIRGLTSEAKKSAVLEALSAVPAELKDRILRGPIKSFIELTSNIESRCSDSSISKANSKNKSTVLSCPNIANGEAVIYVDQKPESIRAGLVRGLAYYIIEIDSQIDIEASSDAQVTIGFVPDPDIKTATRHQAALVFLDEVYSTQKSLSIFEQILPASVINATSKSERDAAFFDPTKTNTDDREAFSSYFIAEVMDSVMCSKETLSAFATSYPKTYALFSKATPIAAAEQKDQEDSGFSLSASPPAPISTTTSKTSYMPTNSEVRASVQRIQSTPVRSSQSSFPVQGAVSVGRSIFDEDTGKRYPMYQKGNDWFYQKDDGKIRQTPVHTEIGKIYDANIFNPPPRVSTGSYFSAPTTRSYFSPTTRNVINTSAAMGIPGTVASSAYRFMGGSNPMTGFAVNYGANQFARWLGSGQNQAGTSSGLFSGLRNLWVGRR